MQYEIADPHVRVNIMGFAKSGLNLDQLCLDLFHFAGLPP